MMTRILVALLLLLLAPGSASAAYECYTKANRQAVNFPELSYLYEPDFQILALGARQTGVIYAAGACKVTAQGSPNMTTAVTNGCTISVSGVTASVTAGNVTHGAAHSTLPRFDLVGATSAGVKTVTAGTASNPPFPPTIPDNHVTFAWVFVPAADTAINADQIEDARLCIVPSAGGGGGNVSNSGTPTSGQVAVWTNATTVQGVTPTGSGAPVLATSPTLVTPILGAARATTAAVGTGAAITAGQGFVLEVGGVIASGSSTVGGTIRAYQVEEYPLYYQSIEYNPTTYKGGMYISVLDKHILYYDAYNGGVNLDSASSYYPLRFRANNVEKMRLAVAGNVKIGPAGDPDASALLDLASTTQGLLPPRMTTTQRNAISSPATGLQVYDTDAGTGYAYNGTAYKSIGTVAGSVSVSATAQTAFTVTFGGTQPNSTYKVFVTPTASCTAAPFYVSSKSTTTFTVTYLAGLTCTATFDYALFQ